MVNSGKNLSVIIPAAGLGRRMKSYGPKSLISLGNGELLINRQLDIIHTLYPSAEIIVVLGFEADKVYSILPSYVKTVENEFYDETNVSRSLSMAVRVANKNNKLLIVYGDLVFNKETLENMSLDTSSVIVDTKGQILEEEVGITIINNYASQFAYGLPTKWTHIVLLTHKELELFKRFILNKNYKKHYGFEILNMILEADGRLKAIEPKNMNITEIDTSKDIIRAYEMLKRN